MKGKKREGKSEKVTFKTRKAFFQPIWNFFMIVNHMHAF